MDAYGIIAAEGLHDAGSDALDAGINGLDGSGWQMNGTERRFQVADEGMKVASAGRDELVSAREISVMLNLLRRMQWVINLNAVNAVRQKFCQQTARVACIQAGVGNDRNTARLMDKVDSICGG